ncbi:MAG: hypothetical protein ACI8SE_000679 [Bacteroidia bacterium]|jgi:hypothetical protein
MKMKYKTGRPSNEKQQKQVQYLLKNNVDTSNMFNLRGQSADRFWTTEFPLFNHDTVYARPLQVRSFDSLGNSDYNWSICFGFIDDFLKDDRLFNTFLKDVDTTLNLQDLSSMVEDTTSFKRLVDQHHDLYIVSFWAKYLGTPSISTIKTIEYFVDTSSRDIMHIKLNLGRWGK